MSSSELTISYYFVLWRMFLAYFNRKSTFEANKYWVDASFLEWFERFSNNFLNRAYFVSYMARPSKYRILQSRKIRIICCNFNDSAHFYALIGAFKILCSHSCMYLLLSLGYINRFWKLLFFQFYFGQNPKTFENECLELCGFEFTLRL